MAEEKDSKKRDRKKKKMEGEESMVKVSSKKFSPHISENINTDE